MNAYKLNVWRDRQGIWAVTSPDIQGLLVVNRDPAVALSNVPGAIEALKAAPKSAVVEHWPCRNCVWRSTPEPPVEAVCRNTRSVHYARRARSITACSEMALPPRQKA